MTKDNNFCTNVSQVKTCNKMQKKQCVEDTLEYITNKYNQFNQALEPIEAIESLSTLANYNRKRTSIYNLHDEVKEIQEEVDIVIKEHKIFTVYGRFYSIRKALVKRGWIEKLHESYTPPGCNRLTMQRLKSYRIIDLLVGLNALRGTKNENLSHVYRLMLLSKMVENEPVYFYWGKDINSIHQKNLKEAITNFIGRVQFNYTTKEGLCKCAKYSQWLDKTIFSKLRVPRTYCFSNGEFSDFQYDFKITAAISLLKYILYLHKSKTSNVISSEGTLSIWMFYFALMECTKFVKKINNENIDNFPVSEEKWSDFLNAYYKACSYTQHFEKNKKETVNSIVYKSKAMLKHIELLCPYVKSDGYMNIWILKPSSGSNGCGIKFCRTLDEVKNHQINSYVIQKYIENPLLIHKTKFDIRQWFLISSTNSLTVWMYKDCYLRFSSQAYDLTKLHESVHLTNNSIQSKYNICCDSLLPSYKMWYLKEFREYLATIGHSEAFDQIMYPGMKECIKALIRASQVKKFKSENGFELYGADFMVTEDFKPWLIEVNSNPAMFPSTPVTSKLCPIVLDQVIKVVVDYAADSNASTGNFELIYKEN